MTITMTMTMIIRRQKNYKVIKKSKITESKVKEKVQKQVKDEKVYKQKFAFAYISVKKISACLVKLKSEKI